MARVRMTREDRHGQLVALAWTIVREEGTDALTLGRLAHAAGITKPVVYSHFPSRAALLVALFEAYDATQTFALEQALDAVEHSLAERARAIATAHVDCVVTHGRELAGVAAALEGAPELADYKRRSDAAYSDRCRSFLEPFAEGALPASTMTAVLGAAEALSAEAAAGNLDTREAYDELTATIVDGVERSRRRVAD